MKYGRSLLCDALVWTGIVFLLALGNPAPGENYFVSKSGNDANIGNSSFPWKTIAHAMAVIQLSSSNRHNLYVATGFYEENFDFKEYLNVYGGYEDVTWAHQVDWFPSFIKKANDTPFILKNNMTLDGFTIYGGLQFSSASPKIEYCKILMSRTHGIDCSNSSSPRIFNCSIKQCAGNGINIAYQSSPKIENTVVAMNGLDGVRMFTDCNPTLSHVTIAHNVYAGVSAENNCNPSIDNSILWENGDDLVNCHAMYSCVGEGDTYPTNNTDDPLFAGWSGYNELYPLYVSAYGSDTGTGYYADPMKHLRQAMAFYRYSLSSISPQKKRGSDLKDLGAYPLPSEYDPYLGNTGKILLSPGNYSDSEIIVTVPVNISGISGYHAVFNPGSVAGFRWGTVGSLTDITVNGGSTAIDQKRGSLGLKSCQLSGSEMYEYLCAQGSARMEDVMIQDSKGSGVEFREGMPVIINSQFNNNAVFGLVCKGSSSPQIFTSRFLSNSTGILCEGTTAPNIRHSHIGNNTQTGIHVSQESRATILMSRIYNNAIGIKSQDSARANVFSNFIYDNTDKALEASLTSKMRIINNTICFNNIGVSSYDFLAVEIMNCILRDNTQNLDYCAASYSDVSGGAPGQGNFDSDPLFTDPSLRDFHITSGSPCIDAGMDSGVYFRDIDGEPRPQGDAIDVGADEIISAWQFSFEKNNQDWKVLTIPSVFTPPLISTSGGSLSLTAPDSWTYGSWDSPAGVLIVEDNQMYRIRFHVHGNTPDLSKSVGMRFRIGAQDSQWVEDLEVYSMGSSNASPPIEGRDYEIYFVPLPRATLLPKEKNDLTFTFDIVNLDTRDAVNGTLSLDGLTIEHIPLDSLPPFSLEKHYEFPINSEGWTTGGAEPAFLKPLFTSSYGFLTMQSRNNSTCFGFWETLVSGLDLEPDRFYRVDFTLRTNALPTQVPSVRFRITSEDNAMTLLRMINSTADASVTLTGQDKIYSCYFIPLQEYTEGDLRGLRLACDLVNLNRQDQSDAVIAIERVGIYSSAIPVFP